jgi:photosystem II stability/assembly factor-like uncharacterized protein
MQASSALLGRVDWLAYILVSSLRAPFFNNLPRAHPAMNAQRFVLAALFLVAASLASHAQSFTWEPLGPVGSVYSGLCIDSGGTIYVYSWEDALVRSTDNGETWQLSGMYRLFDLVAAGRDTAYMFDQEGAVRKTTNAGRTWAKLADRAVSITVTPDGQLYVTRPFYFGGSQALVRFTRQGVETLINGALPGTLYLVGSSASGALFGIGANALHRSTDEGKTWASVDTGVGRRAEFFGQYRQGPLYLVDDEGNVFASVDDGATWTRSSIPNRTGIVMSGAIDHDGALYVGLGNSQLLRTTDGGANWLLVSPTTVTTMLPVPGGMLGGSLVTDMSRSTDGGETWTRSNAGMPGSRVLRVHTPSDSSAVVWHSSQVRVAARITDSVRWVGGKRVTAAEFFEANDGRVYYYDYNSLRMYRTTDEGATWDSSAAGDTLSSSRFAVDREGRLVAAGLDLRRSTDHGETWSVLLPRGTVGTRAVAIDSSGRIVAARGNEIAWFDESASTWRPLAGAPPLSYGELAVMPDGAIVAAIPYGSEAYRSTDEGETWTQVGAGLFSRIADIAVGRDGSLVVATQETIFASRDRGATFFEMDNDFSFPLYAVSIAPGGRVFAGTHFGLYRSSESVLAAPTERIERPVPALRLSPIPTSGSLTVGFELAAPASVTLRVYDATGREVFARADETRSPGSHEVTLDLADLAAGVYLLRVETGSASAVQRFIRH